MYEEYFEKLRIEGKLRNLRESTIYQYTARITKFLRWKACDDPGEVTLEDIRNYIYEIRTNKKRSTQHCNTCRAALKFFYRFVLRKNWDEDEVPYMRRDTKLPKVINLETVELLIDTATEIRSKAIIALMYSSGLRLSELRYLAPDDIYMSTMQVHIRNSKNHRDHWTILSQRALELLIEYWKSNPVKRDFLFINPVHPDMPIKSSAVQTMFKKVGKDAGVPYIHPHILRHSFATHMIENKVPLEQIQAMMGHCCIDTTYKYIHVSNKVLMGIHSPLDHVSPVKKGECSDYEQ